MLRFLRGTPMTASSVQRIKTETNARDYYISVYFGMFCTPLCQPEAVGLRLGTAVDISVSRCAGRSFRPAAADERSAAYRDC